MNKHTATMTDGTVVTRNSKTRVYEYAVEATTSAASGLRAARFQLKHQQRQLAEYTEVLATGVIPSGLSLLKLDDYRDFVVSTGALVERWAARVAELEALDPNEVISRYIAGWSGSRENAIKMGRGHENFTLLPATVNAPAAPAAPAVEPAPEAPAAEPAAAAAEQTTEAAPAAPATPEDKENNEMKSFTTEQPERANYATPAATRVLRADAERGDWLAARKTGFGASDTSKFLGLSKYGDQFTVWADKTGRTPELEDNEAMYWGRAIEPLLRNRFIEDTGIQVRASGLLRSKEYEFLLYTPDGLTADGGLLECKTFGQFVEKDWVGEDGEELVPDHAYSQVQQGLLVTGRSHAWVVGLGSGRNWYVRRVERDLALMEIIISQATLLWQHVQNDTEPPAGQWAGEVLSQLHPVGEGDVDLQATADGELLQEAQLARTEYRLAAEAESKAKAAKDLAKAKIQQITGDAERVLAEGSPLWTYKNTGQFVKSAFEKMATPEQVEEVTVHTVSIETTDSQQAELLQGIVQGGFQRILDNASTPDSEPLQAPAPTVTTGIDADKVKAKLPDLYTAARARRLLVSKK